MKIFKFLPVVTAVVLAGGLLAACEEQSSVVPAKTETKQSTSTSTSAPEKTAWIWPGVAEQDVVFESVLTKANYMIVFDGSGSMDDPACGGTRKKIDEGKEAVAAFIGAIPDDANVGFYVFDGNRDGIRVELNTANRGQVIAAIEGIRQGGGTPLKSAVRAGYDALTAQGQKQLGYGRYALVIVTDGAASSGEDPTKLVNAIINDTPVEIHTVGFCLGANHSLNQPGRTFYASATSAAEVLKSLEDVLAEATDVDVTDFSD